MPTEYRGRGISLMRCLMQDFTIHSNDAGTTVHMYAEDHVMMTPLTLNTDRGVDGSRGSIATGEIDLSNIDVFAEALTTASEGNRRPITVDISAVKYLDSAGINVLFKHADEIDRLHLIVHPLLVRVLTISGLSEIATVESAPAGERNGN